MFLNASGISFVVEILFLPLGSRFYGRKFENNKVCSVLSFLFLENEMTEDVSVKKVNVGS